MAIRADTIGNKISIDDIMDFIPNDHPCFLVEKIVERIDFSEWEDAHWDTPGNPSYHPRVLLRGVVQGYIDGVKSGRELGRRVKTDLPYMYLCGIDGPDFRTFNRFYKEFADVIVLTLVEVNRFAQNIGMLKIGSLALDSTTVKAHASSFNVASEKKIRAILETVYEIILKNDEDDELLGDDSGYEVPIDLNNDEEFEKYYREVIDYAKSKLDDEKLKFPARKQLKNAIKNPEKVVKNLEISLDNLNKSGQSTVNLTDNESL
ncbi:MAG: transposase [Methanobrevibacter millerae]|uniref:Transposase n=1 Tax=Methanobrevibacter millerae TaxID=230361 RepID=A0A8T3VR26_9EURY|nr:transposase [Methanobrevibacter millerae]